MKPKTFLKNHAGFLLILFLFLIVKLTLYRISYLEWDEAVYLAMAKYMYSFGKIGFFEILRPVMLPLLIGSLWKLGFGIVASGKILAVLISLATIAIVYFLSEKIFNKKTALVAALMLALSPVFLEHSFRIMPSLWSVFFVLLALYMLKDKRYFLSGIFGGIAFLFRFTQGAILLAVGLAFLVELLDKKDIKSFIHKSLKFYLSFAIAVIPYLIFNYAKYAGEVSRLSHAIFRPFIYASGTIAISGGQNNPLFYIINLIIQNYLVLFIILAFILFFRKKQYKDEVYSSLAFVFIILLIYFSRLDHQELRYMLDFFIYAVILAAYGLNSITLALESKKKTARYILFAMFALLFIFCFISRIHATEPEDMLFKDMLEGIDGVILSTTPFASVELDKQFEHNFYSLPVAVKEYREREDISAFLLYPHQFEFNNENKELIKNLILNDNLVLSTKTRHYEYLLFVKGASSVSIGEKNEIMRELGITPNIISVSEKPLDSFVAVILVEDAGSVYKEDGKGNFWEGDKFRKINELTKDVTISWNIVPSHLELLNAESGKYLKETFAKRNINIIQKGYSHDDNGKASEFFGLSYKGQMEKISKGNSLIKSFFNVNVDTFIPPFSKADKNTLQALENLGYKIYISGIGDPAVYEATSLKVYKDQLYTMDWVNMKMKNRDEILNQLSFYTSYTDYVIIPFFYPYMETGDFDAMSDLIDVLKQKNALFYTPAELTEWQELISQVNVSVQDNTVILISPAEDARITLTINEGGNYIVLGIENFKIKNTSDSKIQLTVNGKMLELEPGEIA